MRTDKALGAAALVAVALSLAPGSAPAQDGLSPAPEPFAPRDVPPDAVPDAPAAADGSAENNASPDEITDNLNDSVATGLAALASIQQDDGSFSSGRYGRNVAVASLCCLAMMADGNLPGRGEYGDAVEKGLEFILVSSTETGLLASDAVNGPMYGHGFATLFLGEVYGMTPGGADTDLAQRVHEALVKAVDLIERSQSDDGGWRYNPVPYDADVSVTICQIMALRSARNAGIEVSKDVIDRAIEYVRRCQNPDGGFRYQTVPGTSNWSRTAAGVASLYYAGVYEDDALERGIGYLLANALPGSARGNMPYYFYGHYYAVQAMYLAGGDSWSKWWPAIRNELLTRQQAEGTWHDPTVGTDYGTAMALIILQMPKRYLPIFQK